MTEGIEREDGLSKVLLGLISVVKVALYIPLFLTISLSAGYILAVIGVIDEGRGDAAQEIKRTLISIWEGLIPVAIKSLEILLPVITLMMVIGVLKWIIPSGSFSVEKIKDNLPALLALIVISTISVLPLLGANIPLTLGNMAMVIVGYYFGKLKS